MGGSEFLFTILGAVALLLWGVRMVRTGMMRAFGHMLRAILTRASSSRWKAFATGVGITTILQSSTATALLISSFASRGLITLPIALLIMLGADVGTTIVAQIFAFDVRWFWTVCLALGVVLFNATSNDRIKNAGRIAIGFGMMLLSLKVLGDLSSAMRESTVLRMVLSSVVTEPVIAVILSAALTWLAHSSLAIVLLVMSLAAGGLIDTHLALALVLGANIGGSLAPYMALSGSPVASRRVPLGNLIARASVALLILPFTSIAHSALDAANLDPARFVLVSHMVFNVLVALAFLPLVDPLARIVTQILPEPKTQPDPSAPQHLDPAVLDTTPEALACAMRETLRMGDIVLDMLRRSLPAFESNDIRLARDIEKSDDTVDALHEAIKLYLIRASSSNIGQDDARRFTEILTFTINLEHVGDIIDKNLMELAAKRIKKRYTFSAEGRAELNRLHSEVVDNMRLALNVFATRDVDLARRLLKQKATLRASGFATEDKHFERLKQGRTESIETSSIHLDIIRDLKRINSHLTSVAYPILEAAGELQDSRLRHAEPARGTDAIGDPARDSRSS